MKKISTPKGNGPEACNIQPAETHENTNDPIVSTAEKTGKSEATLRAMFALKGAVVHRLEIGGYLVAQYGMTRHCADLPALAAFARQVGIV